LADLSYSCRAWDSFTDFSKKVIPKVHHKALLILFGSLSHTLSAMGGLWETLPFQNGPTLQKFSLSVLDEFAFSAPGEARSIKAYPLERIIPV
jgi:hypothetical protein